jgi:hypothetical protein
VRSRLTGAVLLAVMLAGCTTGGAPRSAAPSSPSPSPSSPSPASGGPVAGDEHPVLVTSTITCEHAIDGSAPPAGYTVVLGAVALPAAPRYQALQATPDGRDGLFAKTGLLVRTGTTARMDVPADVSDSVGIGWSGWPAQPGRSVVVPTCPDPQGTGWLVFAGGFWTDRPLCLPLTVTAGGRQQTVEVGVGTACPGQALAPAGVS